MEPDRLSGLRITLAWLGAALGFALGLLALDLVLAGLAIPRGGSNLELIDHLRAWQARADDLRREGATVVAVLGDSLLLSLPDDQAVGAAPLPERLEGLLGARDESSRQAGTSRAARVAALRWGGFATSESLFLADEIAAARPDVVVVAFNLASLSRQWQRTLTRRELAGWIAPSRVPATLTLPLESIGLTADSLLLYVALESAGLTRAWRWVGDQQLRMGRLRDAAVAGVADWSGNQAERRFQLAAVARGFEAPRMPGRDRETRESARERYGAALGGVAPDDPVLRMLDASLRRLREAGVPVLLVVMPVNLEHLAALGMPEDGGAGLESTLASIAAVARASDAAYLDLHARLADAGFRDWAGHLSFQGSVDGIEAVARELARGLQPLLAEAAR